MASCNETHEAVVEEVDVAPRDSSETHHPLYPLIPRLLRRSAALASDFQTCKQSCGNHFYKYDLSNLSLDWRHVTLLLDHIATDVSETNLGSELDVDLSGNRLEDSGVEKILNSAEKYKHIRMVSIRLNKVFVENICNVSTYAGITTLALDSNPLNKASIRTLSKSLKNLVSLETLSLSRCRLDDVAAHEIILGILGGGAPSLRNLNLAENAITDSSIYIDENPNPHVISKLFTTTSVYIRRLHIAGNVGISDAGAKHLLYFALCRRRQLIDSSKEPIEIGVNSSKASGTQELLGHKFDTETTVQRERANEMNHQLLGHELEESKLGECCLLEGSSNIMLEQVKRENKSCNNSGTWNGRDSNNSFAESIPEIVGSYKVKTIQHGIESVNCANCHEDVNPEVTRMLLNLASVENPSEINFCPHGCSKVCLNRLETDVHSLSCSMKLVQCCMRGCPARIPRKGMNEHIAVCGFEREMCPLQCQLQFTRNEIANHIANDCPRRMLPCPNNKCDCSIPSHNIKLHLSNYCEFRVVSCVYPNCDTKMEARSVDQHERDAHRSLYETFELDHRRSQAAVGETSIDQVSKIEDLGEKLQKLKHLHLQMDESKAQRKQRLLQEAREAKLKSEADLDYQRAKKEELCRHERQEDAKALAIWFAAFPRICEFECGARVLDAKYEAHIAQCENRPYSCELCEEVIQHKKLGDHRMMTCPERIIVCNRDECIRVNVRAKNIDRHNRQYHVASLSSTDL